MESKEDNLIEVGFGIDGQEKLTTLDSPSLVLQQEVNNKTVEFPVVMVSTTESNARFAAPEDMTNLWQHVRSELRKMYSPFRKTTNLFLIGAYGMLLTLVEYLFLHIPLARGWRLDVVRRMGEENTQTVPNILPLSIWRYFRKGMVLVIMRGIYFLPHFIFLYVSSGRLFSVLIDIGWWIWEKVTGQVEGNIISFLLKNLPEFAFEIILQLIVLVLYMVIIWPIYRVTMIKYALDLIRGREFLSFSVFRDSMRIFRMEMSKILGIYFFTLLIDFTLAIALFLFSISTFGFGILIVPIIYFLFGHWPKGYAYGTLAQYLIRKKYITPLSKNEGRQQVKKDDFYEDLV